MADSAFNLTFDNQTGYASVTQVNPIFPDSSELLGGAFTTLTPPSAPKRAANMIFALAHNQMVAYLQFEVVVNNANIYNSIIDEKGVDAPELSTARQVLEASNLVQPGFAGSLANSISAQWALEVRAEYDKGLADIGVSPEERASFIDRIVEKILSQGLPVTPETFDDEFERQPEAKEYNDRMMDSGSAENITTESPETGGNVVYYVGSDGAISKTKVISYNADNGEAGTADVVTADYKFIDGKWVRDTQLGNTTIDQSPEEFIQQLQGSGFTSLAEAMNDSLRIQRSAVMEPEEPVVPPTTSNDGGNGGNSNDDDGNDDTPAVVVAPVEPVPVDPTAPTTGTKWVDTTGGTNVQGGPNTTGHGLQAPIILDLDGDGVEVAFGEDIYFDLDDDGFLEQTSWASADDGFLVIDRNANGSRGAGDGVIDQSNELVLSSLGLEGDTDLQALARYDDNGDGKLDASDAIWTELKVWQDLNQDGKTEGDGTELKTLAAWGITEINLAYDDGTDFTDESNDVEVFGNILHGLAVAA